LAPLDAGYRIGFDQIAGERPCEHRVQVRLHAIADVRRAIRDVVERGDHVAATNIGDLSTAPSIDERALDGDEAAIFVGLQPEQARRLRPAPVAGSLRSLDPEPYHRLESVIARLRAAPLLPGASRIDPARHLLQGFAGCVTSGCERERRVRAKGELAGPPSEAIPDRP
jgi:hypothetical protein